MTRASRGGTSTGRRAALRAIASAAFASATSVDAQPAMRVARVGILRLAAPPLVADDPQAVGIPGALRELGHVEGKNLVLDLRYADGDLARLDVLASGMVAAKPDVIVAVGTPAVKAVTRLTKTIPIVLFGNTDPVATGLVATLARPGGNVTGVLISAEGTLAGKRLELLRAFVPSANRIALLGPGPQVGFELQAEETRKAATNIGIELFVVDVRSGDYDDAFGAIVARRPAALLVGAHNFFVRDRLRIIALAAKHRLPAMYEWREQVADGGLMSYSTSLANLHHRIAAQVDRILKGARPGDLPVEQPTRFGLVVNRETARALGLVIPPAMRLQIDEIIG